MARIFYLAILLMVFVACSEVFEYHPNQIRLEANQKNLTAKNLNKLLEQSPGDTLRFILMGDTQRFYDDLQDFVLVAKDLPADFILHTGDIADFGMAQEYQWVHELMSKLPQPYLTVVGNHDLLANGPQIYAEMYGPTDYSFEYGAYKFILLNTNGREYSFNGQIPNTNWLDQELNNTSGSAIIVGHIPPFDNDFDPNLELEFTTRLKESGKVSLALFGHQHQPYSGEPYEDGIRYHVSSSMKDRSFSLITLSQDYQHVEVINY